MSGLDITSPGWLLILAPLAIAGVLIGQRRSLATMSPRQRTVCIATRILLLLCLILALSGIRLLLPSKRLSVLFLVDRSASISPAAQSQAQEFYRDSVTAASATDLKGCLLYTSPSPRDS